MYESAFLIAIALVIVLIGIYKNKTFASFYSIYSSCYWLVMFFGVIVYINLYVNYQFKPLEFNIINETLLLSLLGLLVFNLAYFFSFPINFRVKGLKVSKLTVRYFSVLCLFFSGLAVLGFVVKNGGLVLLKGNGYEDRLTSNLGAGMFTIFFPLFIPAYAMLLLIEPSKRQWVKYFASGLIFGLLTFLAIGGARMNLAIFICVFLIIGYVLKYIKLKTLIISPFVIMILMTVLVYFRESDNGNQNSFFFWIYLMNSFSPFDSFYHIYNYYNEGGMIPGLSVVWQQFYLLMPRFIFEDKPEVIMNVGNFFTKEILGFQSNLTMSPTINGSFILVAGKFGLFLGSFFIGKLVLFLDRVFYYGGLNRIVMKDINPKSCLMAGGYSFYILYMFNLVRESLDIFLVARVIIPGVIFVFIFMISYLLATAQGD